MEHVEQEELVSAVESLLFATGEPLSFKQIRKVFCRHLKAQGDEEHKAVTKRVKEALKEVQLRWDDPEQARGFLLTEVAEGFAFRSNPKFSDVITAMREAKPVRLSKAAMETLAIVAYRQPATKPEVDHIRGVDCGGTLRLLLEKELVKIVGKKEEPGRPLLYGTTKEFLNFFNIGNLAQLPTLREFHELTDESVDELEQMESGFSLDELQAEAQKLLDEDEEPAVESLEAAVHQLDQTETGTKAALEAEGISLESEQKKKAG